MQGRSLIRHTPRFPVQGAIFILDVFPLKKNKKFWTVLIIGINFIPVHSLPNPLVDVAAVPPLIGVHVLVHQLPDKVALRALVPVRQALDLLGGALRAQDVGTRLEVELQPVVVLAGVHVALGEAAGAARAPLGVGKHEGALDGALGRVGVPSEHGVHGGVPRDVGAEAGQGLDLGLVLTIT